MKNTKKTLNIISIKLFILFSIIINSSYAGKIIVNNKSNKKVEIKFDVQGLDKKMNINANSYKTWSTSRDIKSIEAKFDSEKSKYDKKRNIRNYEATIVTITGRTKPTIKVKSFYTLSVYNPFDYKIKVFFDVKHGKDKTVTIKPKKWKGIFRKGKKLREIKLYKQINGDWKKVRSFPINDNNIITIKKYKKTRIKFDKKGILLSFDNIKKEDANKSIVKVINNSENPFQILINSYKSECIKSGSEYKFNYNNEELKINTIKAWYWSPNFHNSLCGSLISSLDFREYKDKKTSKYKDLQISLSNKGTRLIVKNALNGSKVNIKQIIDGKCDETIYHRPRPSL